jgi:DNA-binding MarR family transcriptional regulator
LTDGNLSRHLQVLSEAGFVEIWKGYHKKRPQTLCRITDQGRRRFFEYINVLETVVQDAMNAAQSELAPAAGTANLADGWSPA